ncbi:MAG: VWA domain-containing protein [Legionellales bacterium]|nr:VWA domain-containing protein [Legionellales bacterium]
MFELACPWVLVFLPLPWLIWFFLPSASLQVPEALHVPFFHAMTSFLESEKRKPDSRRQITLLLLIWFLVLCALSGPRWVGEPQPVARDGHNIMMVLDLSPSMALNDMIMHGRPATRLAVVKRAAAQFVQQRLGDKFGLILFGTQAYLQTPLTHDRHSVLMRLEDATVGLAGRTTSIGDALGLAVKRLQHVPEKGRLIILLTDGVNNSGVLAPLKAAQLAVVDHIKIYTIGLGSEVDPQALGGLFFNMNATADLDEDTLKEVAKMTGGRYFRATDGQSLQDIYQSIHRLETVSLDDASVRPQHEYYPWPLTLAFLLWLFWLFQRGGWGQWWRREEVL